MGITNGKQKWKRKTAAAGPKYEKNINYDDFVNGIVEGSDGKLTRSQVESSDAAKGYQNFVANSKAAQAAYENGVRNKEDKWEKNWLRAFGG